MYLKRLNKTPLHFYIGWLTGFLLSFPGCALSPTENSRGEAKERVFHAPIEKVWRATQLVMQDYPIRISNSDRGLLETALIKGDKWSPPYQKKENIKHGLRYRIRVKVVQIPREDGEEHMATKVIIYKKVFLHKDFFASPEPLSSDGLEEIALLYRIGRELQIDKILEKVQNDESFSP